MYRWVIKEGLYLFMRNQKNSNPLSLLCRLINLMIKVSVVLGAVVGGNGAMAYEEAPFRILETNEIYELREYGDRLAVETSTAGQNAAFRALFNYISGANTGDQKTDMTTPVTQSVKIDMTVPVTQQTNQADSVMQFYLPSNYTIDTAPRPKNSGVRLTVIDGGIFAVRKYSGRSTDANFERNSKILQEALDRNGIAYILPAIKATYNGPFTPFFARRNEAMFRIKN